MRAAVRPTPRRAIASQRSSRARGPGAVRVDATADSDAKGKTTYYTDTEENNNVGKRALRLLGMARLIRPMGLHAGELLLLTCTLLLSTNGVVTRLIYTLPTPPGAPALATLRAGIAVGMYGLSLLAGLVKKRLEGKEAGGMKGMAIPKELLLEALKLGALHGGAIALLLFALQRTTATRAALLVATKNVLVPLFSALRGEPVYWSTWVASTLTTSGVLLMTTTGDATGMGIPFSIIGDIAALGTAVLGSLFTVNLASNAHRFPQSVLTLAVGVGDFLVALMWATTSVINAGFGVLNVSAFLCPSFWALLLWCAICVDAIPRVLEVKGQSKVPATEGQAIFALEMVISSAIACAVLGERLTPRGMGGAGLITCGIALIFLAKWRSKPQGKGE